MKKALTAALAVALAGGGVAAQAYEAGDWVVRVGAVTTDPDSSSDTVAGAFEADVDDDTQIGIIPVYMITDTFGIELLAASPFEHDIALEGKGAAKGTGLDAGSTKHLPPTLSVQWYPRGGMKGWQPYIGAGFNYTIFFDEDVDNELKDFLGQDADLDLDNSAGWSLQAGVDVPISEHWAINAAVWYIDLDTTAKVSPETGDNIEFDVQLDPWVYNIGVAYKF